MKYRANKSGRSTLHYEQMDVRGAFLPFSYVFTTIVRCSVMYYIVIYVS